MFRPRARRARAVPVENLESRRLFAATVIDVMVVYDDSAKTNLNVTDAGIQKLIRQSIESANQVHYNTNDNVVLRLVYTGQVNYNDTGVIDTDLTNLGVGNIPLTGSATTVAQQRNIVGADLVSMICSPSFDGGLANLLTNANGDATQAFSVLKYNALGPGSFVMGHEMGHNMGAGHDAANGSPGPFAYSRGYITPAAANGKKYGDIMSYVSQAGGLILPYFSTPTISYRGLPLGTAAGADLLTTFNVTAPKVAAYRSTLVADAAAPVATLYQTDLAANNRLTFTVRYADDWSVDASSLDFNDVTVTTPEGFTLTPEFVSLDRAGDGYAKLATYRVTLPNSNTAVSSLVFNLKAGQVRDVNNNFAAAGVIAANPVFDNDFSLNAELARDTGTLAAGGSRQVGGNLDTADSQDLYKFTVAQGSTLSAVLSGLGAGAEIQLYRDVNDNDVLEQADLIAATSQFGTTNRTLSSPLTAGTYYLLVQRAGPAATDYTLAFRDYVDTTPPTVTIDAVDTSSTSGNLTFSVIYKDNQELDFDSIFHQSQVAFVLSFNGGGGFSGTTGSPGSIGVLPDGSLVATYSANLGAGPFGAGTMTLTIGNGTAARDAAGNALAQGTAIGSFKTAVTATDTVAPTVAAVTAPPVLVPNGTGYDFMVVYKDNRIGVAVGGGGGAADSNDILVTGPKGYSQLAQFVSGSPSQSGAFRYINYHIPAAGGAWDWTDDGTYTFVLQTGQVKDAAGNAVATGTIGSLLVHVPYPGDATNDDAVDFNDLVKLAQNYNTTGKGVGDGDFNYDGVVDFNDLVSLAQHYNTSKPASAVPGGAVAAASLSADYAAVLASADPVMAKKAAKPAAVFSVAPVRPPVTVKPVPVRKPAARR